MSHSAIPVRAIAGRTTVAALIVFLVLALTSCSATKNDSDSWSPGVSDGDMAYEDTLVTRESAPEMAPVPPSDGAGVDASTVPPDDRMVIRTLGMRLQVDEVESAIQGVRDAVDAVEGMVTAVQVSSDDTPVYRYDASGVFSDGTPLKGYVTARVPPAQLDRFIDAVSRLGTILRQAEDESDVTQEHIDLTARLENLRVQEQRLRELFERAEEVEDLLAIEREIARVRGDIESYEARIAYIERQASMATVTIELVGRQSVIAPEGDDWGFTSAVRAGIRGLVDTINGIIFVALSVSPLVILTIMAWLVIRAILRRRNKRVLDSTVTAEAAPDTSADNAEYVE